MGRSYGGVSGADRQRERRSRLLEAALAVMAHDEWRTATVERLCSDAGLNKRYFYESFSDLDGVAEAVIDDISTSVRDATLLAVTAVVTEPIEQQALSSVSAAVHALVDDPRRARVLLGGVAASPAVHAHRAKVMRGLTAVLIEHARSVHGVELEHDALALVAPAFVVGGSAEAILSFVNGSISITVDELVVQLATLWLITGNGAAAVARSRLSDQAAGAQIDP
ncbi:TetR/AcrR family transcriptional regulator [Mycobacterium deserti]|uniref:TetR/AcrR family transcriptional regulator n=1 Tax=Mycobacterium deserti TaxID=2978347 RepID=A0ABT2MGF8_9MYCO|nr:TetR/AcrR family transcriptional regulator [Mycobacterium deserti]MCT7661352.1 TetR/AcrR family transcriptional regulator [Mycobacterium deserti]